VTDPASERARRPTGPEFSDAVTFSFGDPSAGLHGLARLGLSGSGGSALAVVFDGREPVTTLAQGGLPVDAGADFERLELDGLATTVEEPLQRWTLRIGDDELTFQAAGPPADIEPSEPVARAGGMAGYEQLCRVHGTIRGHEVRCPGQRGHTWGEPDWERIGSTRTVAAWLDDGSGIALTAVRPAGAPGHEPEAMWAALLGAAGSLRVDEPRLSTTYDEGGRQRRAGLELWVGEDDSYPRRATAEVVCGSTLDLGQLRLDCAFMRWRMDGLGGSGRYDVLRRA
jgi:hypothetical protein